MVWGFRFTGLFLGAAPVNISHANLKCVQSTVFLPLCFHLSVNNQLESSKATPEATFPGHGTAVPGWYSSLIGFQRQEAPRLTCLTITSSLMWGSSYWSVSCQTINVDLKDNMIPQWNALSMVSIPTVFEWTLKIFPCPVKSELKNYVIFA